MDSFLNELNNWTVDQSKEWCQNWIALDKLLGDKWLNKLPDFPCSQPGSKEKGWKEVPTDVNSHPGCSTCFRSAPANFLNLNSSGQQCCYDKDGKLITSGTGSGTADRRNALNNPLGHFFADVQPWLVCSKAGMLAEYLDRRPNNKGSENEKPCPENEQPPGK
jgi:hypothetical protein